MTAKQCSSIVYVSKVRRTYNLSTRLDADGIKTLPFNGKMDKSEKVANQEKFMNGEVNVIVATSALGMGVDKSDVGLAVHFDISASLEDYVQEAGRADRDEDNNADCYVLFKDKDLNGHFMMLNQSKSPYYFLLPKNMYRICRRPSRNVRRCDLPLRPSGLRVTGISAIFAPDNANLPMISVANSMPPQESPSASALSRSKPRIPQ